GIRGQLLAGEEPLRYFQARLEIRALEPNGERSLRPKLLDISLSKDGRWRLSNLSPGKYRVRLVGDVAPYHSPVFPRGEWKSYMARRYGILKPAWQLPPDEIVIVRPGSMTNISPWRLVNVQQQLTEDRSQKAISSRQKTLSSQ